MQSHHRQEAKCFVGGLSWSTTAEKLDAYFSNFGQVLEAFVSYDRHTGRPRGFGFVIFEDPAVADKVSSIAHTIDRREVEAKKAVPKENHPGARGSPRLMSAGRTKKVFVGGLTPSIDEAALRQYFEQFGGIQDAVVMYDHDNRRPRGFGFVTFCEEETVDAVLSAGPLQAVHDKQVEIKRAVPRDQMPPPRGAPVAGRGAHAPFIPYGRGQPYGYPPPYQTQPQYGMPSQPPYGGQPQYGGFARPLPGGAGAMPVPGLIGMSGVQVSGVGGLGALNSSGFPADYNTHPQMPGGDLSMGNSGGTGMGMNPMGVLHAKHMQQQMPRHQQQPYQQQQLPQLTTNHNSGSGPQQRQLYGSHDTHTGLSNAASLPPPSPVASFANDNGTQSTPTFSAGAVSSPYAGGRTPGSPYAGGQSLSAGLVAASLAASHHGSGSHHGGGSFQMAALHQTLPSLQTGSAASDSLLGVNSAYATPMAGGVTPLGGATPLGRTVSQSPGALGGGHSFLASSPSAFDVALASPLASGLSIPLMPGSANGPGSLGRAPSGAGLQSSFSETPLGGGNATPVNWATT